MNKDERILKKVGKLLTLYGVNDEEKAKFIADLQDKKYDDQDELEETDAEEVEETEETEEELPNEELGGEEEVSEEVSEDAEEPAGEELAEPEQVEEPVEEPAAEEPAEFPQEQAAAEQPAMEEQPAMAQPQDNSNEVAELKSTIDGLLDRISSLEDLVKKLGAPVEDNIGVEPRNPSGESLQESELDRFNRLRMGK